MSLLRLRLVCFDLVGSQKNQDRYEPASSSPDTEPHTYDQRVCSLLQLKNVGADRQSAVSFICH